MKNWTALYQKDSAGELEYKTATVQAEDRKEALNLAAKEIKEYGWKLVSVTVSDDAPAEPVEEDEAPAEEAKASVKRTRKKSE